MIRTSIVYGKIQFDCHERSYVYRTFRTNSGSYSFGLLYRFNQVFNMKAFKSSTRPYSDLLIENFDINNAFTVSSNGLVQFDGKTLYLIAKASGLKSNKKRAMKKRLKLIISQALLLSMQS